MKINILLVYPPVDSYFIDSKYKLYGLAPPLGILSLASVLEKDGHDVNVVDFSAELFSKQKLAEKLNSVDVVGITVLTISLNNVKKIIQLIREIKPYIKVIIGGPHCTLFPEQSLVETDADICVEGDGENAIIQIIKAFNDTKSLSIIPGVYYKEKTKIIHGPKAQPIQSLDDIPYPARHLVKRYIYGREYNPDVKEGEFTSVVTSRGCPFSCRFCSRGSIGMKKYRTRSTENILEEILKLYKSGYRYIAITDDTFPCSKTQALELFDEIVKKQLDMKFYITSARVDFADEDLYLKMRKAGVVFMQYGLESANQDVLDFYNKKITPKDIVNAVNMSHRYGFFTAGSFILGAPFETNNHFSNTVKFAKSLPLHSVSFLPLRYMAGSELWKEAVNDGKIGSDDYLVYADSDLDLALYHKNYIIDYCKKAQRMYYYRFRFFWNLLSFSLKNNDLSFLRSFLSIFFSKTR